eukprot:scaffold625_cov420-Prasinococcus_capsulatus_cf.AAC.28
MVDELVRLMSGIMPALCAAPRMYMGSRNDRVLSIPLPLERVYDKACPLLPEGMVATSFPAEVFVARDCAAVLSMRSISTGHELDVSKGLEVDETSRRFAVNLLMVPEATKGKLPRL